MAMLWRKKRHLTDELGPLDQAAGAMVGIGALNWGLVALTGIDAVRAVFGRGSMARAIYALVGASAVYSLIRGRQLAEA
jgi:uncharacterized membrane protein YuzA (DUF378 family)